MAFYMISFISFIDRCCIVAILRSGRLSGCFSERLNDRDNTSAGTRYECAT